MINCCSSPIPEQLCFRLPESYSPPPPSSLLILPDCRSCARLILPSSNLLHAVPLKHDPYTPDSMDSPSPNAIASAPETCIVDLPPASSVPREMSYWNNNNKLPERAVSPALLKSRLELIAKNRKKDGSASNSNSDLEDDIDEQCWGTRKSRSNSDVSWQRSHLLTRAWLQGKGQQAYHSFSSSLHRTTEANKPDVQVNSRLDNNNTDQMNNELVIPRIAIINASNFESNASSVHLYGEEAKKEQYLDTWYTNTRTRSLSEAGSSQGRSATVEEEKEEDHQPGDEKDQVIGTSDEKVVIVDSRSVNSKNTTRSNSIQSQEANVSLKLKAYNKVTERCKKNIVGKKGRCEKCCVLS